MNRRSNYIGSKAQVLIPDHIRENRSECYIDDFIDAFGGGFNVGINMPVQKAIVYNEYQLILSQELIRVILAI